MTALLQALLTRRDNRELIRDQVAAILKVEIDAQRAFAAAAGLDPDLWTFRVFSERSSPWAAFDDEAETQPPIVNVWLETSTLDSKGSLPSNRQKFNTTIHVDCYGFGVSHATPEGQRLGEVSAAGDAERASRLARQILFSAHYSFLGFPQQKNLPAGSEQVVLGRMPSVIQPFQPQINERPVERVFATRLDLDVSHNEFAPEYQGVPLELVAMSLTRAPSGEWLSTHFDVSAAPAP